MRSAGPMRAAKISYAVISILFCALGLILVINPTVSALWIGTALGIGMIVFGIIKLLGFFSRDLFRLAFQYDLAFGVLLIVLGIITLAHPNAAMNFLCIMFGIPVLADGLFKIQIALDSRKFGIPTWWLMLVLALLTCIIGLILTFCPAAGTQALLVLIGLSLLLDGILNLSVAICAVKIVKNQRPDTIDGEYHEIGKDQ